MTVKPLIAALTMLWAGAAGASPPSSAPAGLWAGSLHLCRDTVQSATLRTGLHENDMVLIELTPDARGQLTRMTTELIGQKLPLRLDGRTIMAPDVHVPMDLGVLLVSFVFETNYPDAKPIRDAAIGAC